MFKKLIFCVAFVSLLSVLTACNNTEREGETQSLTIGLMPSINSIPYIVAQQRGYLPDNVNIEIFRDPTERDSAMMAGQVDGIMTDMLAFFLFVEGGEDMVGVSATQGRFGIAVNDSEIKSPRDLEGRPVAMISNSIIEIIFDLLMLEDGGNPDLVIREIIPQPPLRIEMLKAGQVAAAVIPEPLLSTAANDPGGRVLAYSEAPFTLIMVGRDTYENKMSQLDALFAAVDKAIDFMEAANDDEFLPAAVQGLGLGDDVFAAMLPVFLRYSLPGENYFYYVQEWMRDNNRIAGFYQYSDLIHSVR